MADLQIHREWQLNDKLLNAVRGTFTYGPNDDRATGYLFAEDEQDWPSGLDRLGPALLVILGHLLKVHFTIVAFQAYRDGAGCDWHADEAFDAQAILSLGVTRTFGVRRKPAGAPRWMSLRHSDLVFMPSGFQAEWQHCVPLEDVPGERCSLVFRTKGVT